MYLKVFKVFKVFRHATNGYFATFVRVKKYLLGFKKYLTLKWY
nr:MAG TPA: hypothetical protein [Caudoviricetes sp.]